jgi:plastocyanin
MRTETARRVSAVVGGLVLAVVVAGCGSSGPGGQSPGSTAPAASSQGSAAAGTPTSTAAAGGAPSSVAAVAAVVITVKDFAYQVPTTVAAGSTVMVMNLDRVAHTVTADTSGSLFDVNIDAGGSASFTAPTTPGSYSFHCVYHGNMHGTLVVS